MVGSKGGQIRHPLNVTWAGSTVPGGRLVAVPVVLLDCTCLPATAAGPPDTTGILASLYTINLGCY